MNDLHTLTISSALDLLRGQKITPQDLAEACFRQIERLNPTLNAFITVCDPQAPGNPQPADNTIPVALANTLGGIPIAVKDLFDTAGIRTTAGSKFFADNIPDSDAFVIEKLKLAGATMMGKTNTHEIALGVTGNNPHFGTAHSPWDTTRIPGGSSSGSAIAVATGMALGAFGTDTGGAIRIPASLCGVVGFKPTYGPVSLRGVFPLSWNLDHVGPLTSCVRDACVFLGVLGFATLGKVSDADGILLLMLEQYAPVWLAGILGAGIISAVMGSDAHQVLALSTMFTKDIYQHYGGREKYGEKAAVHFARAFIVVVTLAAYVVALNLKDKQGIFKIAVRYAFSGFSALAPVMIAALFWKRSTKWGALASTLFTAGCLVYFAVLQNTHQPGDVIWQIGQDHDAIKVLFLNPRGDVGFWNGYMTVVPLVFGSALCMIIASLLTPPPSRNTIEKYFPNPR